MLRRSAPTLTIVSALMALLLGCGNPSSNQADEASQEDETVVEAGEEDVADSDDYEEATDEQEEAGEDDAGGYDRQAAYPRRDDAPVATRDVGAGVSGDVGMFYDDLAQDGAWVDHPDYSYVWIPSRMGPGWRPYQEGRWIWTDDYGWYWESQEPFGWAVYHYGRWDYDPGYGWFWVPGDTWAPAWVTWRYGGGTVGWAPVAPDRPGFAAGLPRRYAPPIAESWVFVEARDFTAPDIGQHALPISRIGASLTVATDIRTPGYQNGSVINFGAPRDEMQRYVRGPIQSRELVYVGNPDHMFDDVRGRRVGIYRPLIADGGGRRKPQTVVAVTQSGRVIVREYAQVAPSAYDVPSAALLDVLDDSERRGLRETRLTAKEAAVEQRLKQLRQERAALLKQRQEEAAKLKTKLEKERKRAMAERRRNRELLREARRKRAVDAKLDADAGDAKKGGTKRAKPDVAPAQEAVAPATQPTPPPKAKTPAAPRPAETQGAPVEPSAPAAEVVPQQPPAEEAKPEPAPSPKPAKAPPAPEPVPAQEAVAPPAVPESKQPDAVAPAPVPPPADAADEAPRKKRRAPQDAEVMPAAPAASEPQPEAQAPSPGPAPAEQRNGTVSMPDDGGVPPAAEPAQQMQPAVPEGPEEPAPVAPMPDP